MDERERMAAAQRMKAPNHQVCLDLLFPEFLVQADRLALKKAIEASLALEEEEQKHRDRVKARLQAWGFQEHAVPGSASPFPGVFR